MCASTLTSARSMASSCGPDLGQSICIHCSPGPRLPCTRTFWSLRWSSIIWRLDRIQSGTTNRTTSCFGEAPIPVLLTIESLAGVALRELVWFCVSCWGAGVCMRELSCLSVKVAQEKGVDKIVQYADEEGVLRALSEPQEELNERLLDVAFSGQPAQCDVSRAQRRFLAS